MRLVRPLVLASALASALGCSSGSGSSSSTPDGAAGEDALSDSLADTSANDAADAADAADTSPDAPAANPIVAPDGQWTWVPFPDAHCADGSTTGIGVNLKSGATRVLIVLEGGGACWDETTCYTLMTAANISTGYDETKFQAELSNGIAPAGGFLDRTATGNPFKDDSFVFVPYCTGDDHAGDHVATYGAHGTMHVGYRNLGAYLARLVPTFASAQRVTLAGSSSGGFGALVNAWRVQQAFGSTRLDVIDDSGTFMPADVPVEFQAQQRVAWNLAATLPAGCTGCATSLAALYPFVAQTLGQGRAALLSYAQDSVLPNYFGITTAQFTTGLNEALASDLAPSTNFRAFVVGASGHVLWQNPALATNGTTLQQFLTKLTTDDPTWATVKP